MQIYTKEQGDNKTWSNKSEKYYYYINSFDIKIDKMHSRKKSAAKRSELLKKFLLNKP